MYNIVDSRILYENNKIKAVYVLIDDRGEFDSKPCFKCYYATHLPCAGYFFISPKTELSTQLLQNVAASGMKFHDYGKIFKPIK